ncbi:hypothetical protein BDZ89DRAFT_1135269 [Hymenopellis radicata]|nr:hypothetical protein BDZ89DRAFT_1135269 [Hymenopellis radicata]
MGPTFEDYGLTVADVQSLLSSNLHPRILLTLCHGIYTCIFLAALNYIAESTQPNRKRIILASIITFLWCTNTTIVGLQWNSVDEIFITHGLSLEDEFDFATSGSTPAIALTSSVLRSLNTILADLILVYWRCWVLYGGNLMVTAVPSLCLITETISVGLILGYFDISAVGAGQVNWTLVYYSMTVATNSLCTFLILFRIVQVSGVGASLKTYRGIIEILVESAAMYAAIYISLLLVYAYEFYSPNVVVMTAYTYPEVISYSITGIAPTLIIARVMAGHSRPNDSWTRPSLPHLRSPMRSLAESLQFASAPDNSTGTEHTPANVDVEQGRAPDIAKASEEETAEICAKPRRWHLTTKGREALNIAVSAPGQF